MDQKGSHLHLLSSNGHEKQNNPHFTDEESVPTARRATVRDRTESPSRGERVRNPRLSIPEPRGSRFRKWPEDAGLQRRELGAHTFAGVRAGLRGRGVHRARGRRPADPPLSAARRAPHVTGCLALPARSAGRRDGGWGWGLTRRRHLSDQPTLAGAGKSRENERLSAPSLACPQTSREDGLAFHRAEATSPA